MARAKSLPRFCVPCLDSCPSLQSCPQPCSWLCRDCVQDGESRGTHPQWESHLGSNQPCQRHHSACPIPQQRLQWNRADSINGYEEEKKSIQWISGKGWLRGQYSTPRPYCKMFKSSIPAASSCSTISYLREQLQCSSHPEPVSIPLSQPHQQNTSKSIQVGSNKFQIFPEASTEILHHTVRRTWISYMYCSLLRRKMVNPNSHYSQLSRKRTPSGIEKKCPYENYSHTVYTREKSGGWPLTGELISRS